MDAPGTGAGRTEDEAWADLTARWSDEEAHRVYLSRFNDLAALAAAGSRYREALARTPGDPMALRWREELIRKATVLAMSQMPRTAPPRPVPPGLRRAILALLALASLSMVVWIATRLSRLGAP